VTLFVDFILVEFLLATIFVVSSQLVGNFLEPLHMPRGRKTNKKFYWRSLLLPLGLRGRTDVQAACETIHRQGREECVDVEKCETT
jgi:hypothetical protein